ncbi:hypothetical protein [Arthrobacter sp. GMC3]|uniref:hypothetical protein n=1 Tax=Arthrobacter sp. GMC3 TaxID=2058894 RepID=UPI0015E2CD38|nr:hypothetical protein [Arthrobacter sp. GMC3]
MSKHPDRDADLILDPAARDPLADVYSEMVSPDIAEINDHATTLEQESETETDHM